MRIRDLNSKNREYSLKCHVNKSEKLNNEKSIGLKEKCSKMSKYNFYFSNVWWGPPFLLINAELYFCRTTRRTITLSRKIVHLRKYCISAKTASKGMFLGLFERGFHTIYSSWSRLTQSSVKWGRRLIDIIQNSLSENQSFLK